MIAPMVMERDAEQRDELVGRLFQATLGAMDLFAIYLGDRLGLYRALAGGGPATAAQLAARTSTHERYAREWLEQQAVTGLLAIDDPSEEAAERRYCLPPGHAEVLLDRESLNHLAPLARYVGGLGHALPTVADAFRRGQGVPWSAFGMDAREAQADMNRPVFLNLLGREWLPSIPDVHARLQADPPARVADVGCGGGWSSIGIARAYPKVHLDGLDVDEPSIALARANAAEAGLADRVSFHARDAADPDLAGRYDLVTAFEVVHDLAQPVEVLRAMRALAGGRRRGHRHGREGGRDLCRARRRGRALHVWVQCAVLPAGRPGRVAIGGHWHRDAPRHAAALRPRGRLQGGRDPADRARLLPPLPPGAVTGLGERHR